MFHKVRKYIFVLTFTKGLAMMISKLYPKRLKRTTFQKILDPSGFWVWFLIFVLLSSSMTQCDSQPAACNTQMMRTVIRACGLAKRSAPTKLFTTYIGKRNRVSLDYLARSYDRLSSLYRKSRVKRGLLLAQQWFHRCCQGECPVDDIGKLC